MTEQEYESRIGELELEVEELERTHSIALGFVLGSFAHHAWHSWAISTVVAILTAWLYWSFLASRPFSRNTPS